MLIVGPKKDIVYNMDWFHEVKVMKLNGDYIIKAIKEGYGDITIASYSTKRQAEFNFAQIVNATTLNKNACFLEDNKNEE